MQQSYDTFFGMPLNPRLKQALERKGFKTPTPIQAQAIPPALTGKDLMGIAQTGTGKTLAFGLPMLQAVLEKQARGLVVVPTRELALQVYESLRNIGGSLGVRIAPIIGGESMSRQQRDLRQSPQIVIATPGRLIDHMQQRTIKLADMQIFVLDEADRMLDMGFAPQLKQIAQDLPAKRQTMLFSATMPQEIIAVASAYLTLPLRVEVAPAGSTAAKVTQELFFVSKPGKLPLLKSLLKEYHGSVIVFSRTKFGAKKIAKDVRDFGVSAAEIHSNRSLNQRLEALRGFKNGKYRVLVATDIAARGIDVTGIELVVNFDLPENPDDYVHRIGRTARAGQAGHAISFATPDQKRDVRDIERLIKKQLPVSVAPGGQVSESLAVPAEQDDRRKNYNQRPRRSKTAQGKRGPRKLYYSRTV